MSRPTRGPRGARWAALLMACASSTTLAQAQDAQTDADASKDVEKVVVTGRRAVSPALKKLRKDQKNVADSLTQAQIENLPDNTLAESLDRIVGVSSDRGFGTSEGRTVTVRGFDARYNSMTVDGNPVWNSSRNNRGTQLDVFPSSVVAQVDVFKTVTPEFDANSIGGHVAMRTLRAFDGGTQPYFRARASYGFYEQSGLPDDGRPSLRVDAGGKFTFGANNDWGVVLGVDYQQHEFYDEANEVTAYTQSGGLDILNGDGYKGIFQRETETLSAYAKVETRATDALYAFASLSYFDNRRDENWNRGGVFSGSNRVTSPGDLFGTFTGATSEYYFETYDLERRTIQASTGLDYRLGDVSAVSLRASYLNYDHDESLFRSEKFQLGNLSGSYEITDEAPIFVLNPNANIHDPTKYLHRTGANRTAFDQVIPHEDDVYHARADYHYNSHIDSEGFGFEAGTLWRRLDRTHDQHLDNWALPAGTVFTLADVIHPDLPGQLPNAVSPFFVDTDAYREFMEAHGIFTVTPNDTSDYTLVEDVAAAYATVIWDLGALRLLGGARVEYTDFENVTGNTESGSLVTDRRNIDYTNVLPNFQATYDISEDFRLRAAATRTLARPDFADFAVGQTITFDSNGYPVINGSNPELGPRVSDNYDLAFDWFFGGGFFSVGIFRKELQDEIFRERRETLDSNGTVILTETIPLNTGDATVRGYEISWVQDRLPEPFDAFGFYGNFTHLDGSWTVVFTDGSTRTVGGLRNQPEWLGNFNFTYTYGPFDATLAYRARGRTFTGSFGTTEAGDIWVDNYDRIDLSANYKLGDGFKLTGQVRNLTDEFWIEQTGIDNDSLRNSYNPGRSFWLGVTYKPDFD